MILLIDTAGNEGRVALYECNKKSNEKIVAEQYFVLTPSLSQQLLREIDSLLVKNEIERHEIQGIVCVKGPGHFTSIRIGVVTANTLAFALRIPINGVLQGSEKEGFMQLRAGKYDAIVEPVYDAMPDIR